MKLRIIATLFTAATALALGCTSVPKGAAYHYQDEFKARVAEEFAPALEWGYTIEDIRFSDDYKQALVVLSNPDAENRPTMDVILKADEFDRYVGSIRQPFHVPGASRTTPIININVALPNRR